MISRVKEMDGLRGIAVILVMALHIFNRANEFTKHPVLTFISDLTTIGWIGVDIFFVLSGYLITSILLKAREKEHYFKNFYARRILRIVPLYYATMLVVFLVIIPIKEPEFSVKIPQLIPVQLLYLQNWLGITAFVQTTGYLWVTWSLAIEEQFYLFWPALVYFMKREHLVKFSIGYILLSAVIRIIGVLVWANTSKVFHFFYYNSFSRFDELIFGGLLAIGLSTLDYKEKIKKFAAPVFWTSTVVFIILCLIDLPNLPHPNYLHIPLNTAGYTTLTISTAALISIFITHPESSVLRRIFRNGALEFLGKYSYAMYLFHIPVTLILLDLLWWTHYRGWKIYLLYIASSFLVTIVLSFASWHLFEKHMLNLKKYFEYK